MNEEKVFLVRKGEIEGRLDCYYHKPEFERLRKSFSKQGFQYLKKFIVAWNRGDGPREGFYTDDIENGVYFLRINNLKENSIDLTDVKLITRFVHDKTLKRSQVTAGDLIFAISGTKDNLGTVSIVPDFVKEANLNSALIRLDLDLSKLDEKYFCLLFSLNFIRTQIDYIGKGAAQNNLNNEEISQIQIPIPPLKIQKQIIEKLEAAYNAKRGKEAKARSLLDGIDAYLLERLGIETPAAPDVKKTFFARSSKISGGRFDPFYHQPLYVEVNRKLQNSAFNLKKLREVSTKIISGLDSRDFIEMGVPYLRVSNVKPLSFDLSDVKFISPIESDKDIQLQKNDLLITRKGSFGNAVIVDESVLGSIISSEVFRIPLRSNIIPQYIAIWLNTKIARTIFDRIKTGGIMGHITQDVLGDFLIPVPPLEIQAKIAAHIQSIRERAKELEREARAEVERAKAEVEQMILGEVSAAVDVNN